MNTSKHFRALSAQKGKTMPLPETLIIYGLAAGMAVTFGGTCFHYAALDMMKRTSSGFIGLPKNTLKFLTGSRTLVGSLMRISSAGTTQKSGSEDNTGRNRAGLGAIRKNSLEVRK